MSEEIVISSEIYSTFFQYYLLWKLPNIFKSTENNLKTYIATTYV